MCWIEREEPWTLEAELISQLDLPLNLDQNRPPVPQLSQRTEIPISPAGRGVGRQCIGRLLV
ncbi:GIY-YIG nuclease family protein [Streptomyces sp. NPDC057696]|uniref:GIY-YIG nuclease family protein n=1 Tax=Streptomyces sp. NPDC057696 TaxID=3346218 RepID=UPI0036A573DE